MRSKTMPPDNAIEHKVSAIALYSRHLRPWARAAAFWLAVWWIAGIGGAFATAYVAGNGPGLRDGGGYTLIGHIVAWFALSSSLVMGLVKPWRFHRGYQRATYSLRAALDKARLNPRLETRLAKVVDDCQELILAAGKDLDANDGLSRDKDDRDDT